MLNSLEDVFLNIYGLRTMTFYPTFGFPEEVLLSIFKLFELTLRRKY